jgi:hypothetical protein
MKGVRSETGASGIVTVTRSGRQGRALFGVGAVRKDDVHDIERRILGDPVEIRRIDRVGRQLMLVGNEIRLSSIGAANAARRAVR